MNHFKILKEFQGCLSIQLSKICIAQTQYLSGVLSLICYRLPRRLVYNITRSTCCQQLFSFFLIFFVFSFCIPVTLQYICVVSHIYTIYWFQMYEVFYIQKTPYLKKAYFNTFSRQGVYTLYYTADYNRPVCWYLCHALWYLNVYIVAYIPHTNISHPPGMPASKSM